MILITPRFEILSWTPTILQLIELAGRVCYKSEEKITDSSAEQFIERLLKAVPPHESVIEHGVVTVKIICDRGVTHELVRHRIASFSQESTRYCNYSKGGIALIHPPGLTEKQKQRREAHFWHVQELYNAEISEGVSPQIARGVLPNALKTEIVITANVREWRHIFRLRTSTKAHPQMREILIPLLSEFCKRWPILFNNIRE